MNLNLARQVLQKFSSQGVREVVVCAGARNSPFLQVLEKSSGLRLFSFFEERSAGFFALGRIKAHDQPVAVITTSGTAVAELLPPVIEAFYTGLPLVVVSADRPKHFRGSGAPQAIEQKDIFGGYTNGCFDLESVDEIQEILVGSGPMHVNVCLDEPLLSGEDKPWEVSDVETNFEVVDSQWDVVRVESPLVLVSTLAMKDLPGVLEFLNSWNVPTYLEGTSGLRERFEGDHRIVHEKDLGRLIESGACKSVIRIGGVPTLRFWRDLEARFSDVPVLSFSDLPFSGLGRSDEKALPLRDLAALQMEGVAGELSLSASFDDLLERHPQSEAALFYKLSYLVGDEVYVGNSLPIREWDLAARRDKPIHVYANRGANGIDGQVSTFLGWAQDKEEAWGIFGDLTAMYDLAAPWAISNCSGKKRIVVINNSGGQIFSRLFENPKYRNTHRREFRSWAQMWGLAYHRWQAEVPDSFFENESCVIEIVPDSEQSRAFWEEFDRR